MIVPIGIIPFVCARDLLGPEVADVMRFAGIVPGDYFDEVGLEGEDLGDAFG